MSLNSSALSSFCATLILEELCVAGSVIALKVSGVRIKTKVDESEEFIFLKSTVREWKQIKRLNSVNVIRVITAGVVAVDIIELDVVIQISSDKVDRLIDLDGLWKLAIGLEVSGLVRRVLLDHVSLGVLVITETNQDDVRLVYPDLYEHFVM